MNGASDVTGGGLPQEAGKFAGWGLLMEAQRKRTVTILANENARALRKRLTPQEVKLWTKLRELKALGFKFRRQAPIGRYIVDFVSFRSRLVIEADGGQHGLPRTALTDQVRDAFLLAQGFRVLRFWNSDVDENLTGVMESILAALNQTPPAASLPTPPDWPSASHPKSELRSSRP